MAATATAVGESVDGGDDVVCGVCMDVYRDPVSLECGHTVCRSCALTTLVAAARLAQLPAAVTATTKETATAAPPAHSRVSANDAMPEQTNAPQSQPTTASDTPSSSSLSSGCRWGCCSHDTPGLTKELNDISEKEVETISKINAEQLSVPKVITEGCTPILADLQLILGAVETSKKPAQSLAPSNIASLLTAHKLGVQCTSMEAVVKNHQALISKANQVVQQQQSLDVLQAHSVLSSSLSDKSLLLDTQRLEPCEQAKGFTWKSGPRDEVIGMIRGFGTVTKGRVPNTPSGGRAPTCTRPSSSSPQSQQATDATTTTITVQWDKPSPLSNETTPEQVVGYNVMVSNPALGSASSSTGGVVVVSVNGRETTKCDVTVDSKNEVSVAVCAVSLVGSSEPTQRATVPPLPPGPREVEVFAWGAAGGANNSQDMAGGPGGFSTARMLIKTGTKLTIVH
ncbi:hypothetical protein Pelo_18089 [Pelomyxa schiedti]|nr:hypothetical protein Pelo_18089 [Pelomyxa schiedti]